MLYILHSGQEFSTKLKLVPTIEFLLLSSCFPFLVMYIVVSHLDLEFILSPFGRTYTGFDCFAQAEVLWREAVWQSKTEMN